MVTHVLKGKRKIPREDIDKWANAIGLDGEDREEFINGANQSHATESTRERIEDLESQVIALTAQLAERDEQIKALELILKSYEKKLAKIHRSEAGE